MLLTAIGGLTATQRYQESQVQELHESLEGDRGGGPAVHVGPKEGRRRAVSCSVPCEQLHTEVPRGKTGAFEGTEGEAGQVGVLCSTLGKTGAC